MSTEVGLLPPRPQGSLTPATTVQANTDIFSADLSPSVDSAHASIFRIHVQITGGAILSMRQRVGGVYGNLNNGVALTNGARQAYDVPVRNGESINFRLDALSLVEKLTIDECFAGGP